MKNIIEIKKFGSDKIALLALLALALLMAKWVSVSRSSIKLTEPIILDHMGLSVKMPLGTGWQASKKWKYIENQYILTAAFFNQANRQMTASIKCQYLLAAQKDTTETLFQQKASQFDAKILETSQTQTESLTFDWAQIKDGSGPSLFIAIAKLPDQRQINIELIELAGDNVLAENAFKKVLENISFHDNQFLHFGCEIVSQIKNTGINSFLFQPQKDFFLIKDSQNHNIGFSMDLLANSTQLDSFNILSQSFSYYVGKNSPYETASEFQSDNTFDKFAWKTETSTGINEAQMTLESDGLIRIRKSFPNKEQTIDLSPAAIPEVFIKQLLEQMVKAGYENMIIDIIDAGGSVTPMLVKKITATENYASAIKIQLLNDQRFFQDIYFDSQMEFEKIIRSTNIILEKTTMENIMKLFPIKAEHIRAINKEFERKAL